ncbi:MAG TPA: hypothetical protein VFJ02_23040 [Vicinamibacterales bacterium]|nr:hypothetical protein [Vicinamibacterales bacterium]
MTKSPRSLSVGRAILYGTLIVGVLDALDAIIVFGLRSGATPARIFRGIAAGGLGRAAATGGTPAAVLGVVLHFTVALGIVTTYIVASRYVPALNRRPFLYGPLYGIAAYFVMNLVVIPLSAIGAVRFTAFGMTNGLIIHALGVGLPAALIAARIGPARPSTGAVTVQEDSL